MPLKPGGAFFCYPVLLLAAFLLAQGIKTPVTHMLYCAVLLIPVGVAAELIIIRLSLRAAVSISDTVTAKREPVRVFVTVTNKGPIPVPYVRAEIVCTDPLGKPRGGMDILLSLLPFSVCRPEDSAEFDFVGEYTLEADSITVSDLFRTVYMRIPCKFRETVTVLPNRIALPPREPIQGYSEGAASDDNTTGDDGEFTDNREYRSGDSPKRIHWKLSSKKEELTVRDMSADRCGGAFIICDMCSLFGGRSPIYTSRPEYSETADLACMDAVAENVIAAVARELECGGWAEVCFTEYGEPAIVRVQTADELERLAIHMSTLRPDSKEGHPVRLAAGMRSPGFPVVIVSPRFDDEAIKMYAEIAADDSCELIVCSDRELFDDGSQESEEYSLAKQRLSRYGITAHFVSGTLPPLK